MAATEATWIRKLSFCYVSIVVAGGLILLSVHLALGGTMFDFGTTIQKNAIGLSQGVGHGLQAVAHTIGRTPKLVVSAVDVTAFIRPADRASSVPTITTPVIAEAPKALLTAPKPHRSARPYHAASIVATATVPSGSNGYAWGNCTWWVAARRAQIHDPIPSSWGNAAAWAIRARHDGYTVDHQPTAGAIMQTPYSAGGLGHVAFVESVDPDGTWHISEMNVVGLDIIDHQIEPPDAAARYSFIHDRR